VQAQTLTEFEIIVVVDGPDPGTQNSLTEVCDDRLRVIALPQNVGLGEALNTGIRHARATWVALLDDDDEWLPSKLETQMQAAALSGHAYPIICSRFIARTDAGDLLWPLRLPGPGEPLCEYLFSQSGLRGGEGMVLPSTILTRRELFQKVPWRPGLPRLDDVDWLLRAIQVEGAAIEFVGKMVPLAIYSIDETRPRMTNASDWRHSLAWAEANRQTLTDRAYASFLLTATSQTARRAGHWRAFVELAVLACRHGRPAPIDFFAHLLIWVIPVRLRRRLVALMSRPPRAEG